MKNSLLVLLLFSAGIGFAKADSKEVTIAHQDMIVPFRAAQAAGELEKATGYKIKWKMFGGGGDVLKAMASGEVPIGEAGSSAVTIAAAQGLNVQIVWILDEINNAEQLVMTEKSGVTDIAGIKGKKIATPLASTSHYQLVFAMRKAGLKASDVQVLNMRPSEIAAAWERGDIDGAFIWNPVLSRVKEQGGKVILSSADVAKDGAPTFDAVIVDKGWAAKNREFVTAMVGLMAKSDAAFNADRAAFTADPERVKQIAKVVGSSPEDVAPALDSYAFLPAREQVSDKWLGGGVANALATTASFLKEQGRIVEVPADFRNYVNGEFAAAAADKKP
ncbi:MAG: taurine ABC transporter substrate-binding protein [Afipia sp.]|nr:taurine ABC transporter substrate-binding protein [Afipia sp.]